MEKDVRVYLVNKDGGIKYIFKPVKNSYINGQTYGSNTPYYGYEEKAKWKAYTNDKDTQLYITHTEHAHRLIDLPSKLVNITGINLAGNKMIYYVFTIKNALFLDENLDTIYTCEAPYQYNCGVFYKDDTRDKSGNLNENNEAVLLRATNHGHSYSMVIDLVNRKLALECPAKIDINKKEGNDIYYMISDSNGYLYKTSDGGKLLELGYQKYALEVPGVGNLGKEDTMQKIQINGKSYFSAQFLDKMVIYDEDFNKIDIDTGDVRFVKKHDYMKYIPKNKYVCMLKSGETQICEFSDTKVTPIGNKFSGLTWYSDSYILLSFREDLTYNDGKKFVDWNGEIIGDLTGDVERYLGMKNGKHCFELKIFDKYYKDTPKYAIFSYDKDLHRLTDYYADITITGDGDETIYECETFEGNIIKLDSDFNNIDLGDIETRTTSRKNCIVVVNNGEKTAELKWLIYNNYKTAKIPYNYSDIIFSNAVKVASSSFIVKTDDNRYILYSIGDKTLRQTDEFTELCNMDAIVYTNTSDYLYLYNKEEEYPVRLVKIMPDNKLRVNRRKLKTVFHTHYGVHGDWFYDGGEVGTIKIGSKVEFTDIARIWYHDGDIEERLKTAEPGIYFMSNNNELKREGI